jgi:rhodanese-related sulfurtransferase
MKSVSASELSAWLADEDRPPPVLLDVREPWETQICRIEGSELMPMQTLPGRLSELDPDRPVVCICHHGGRSMQVAMFLTRQGFKDACNLTGGVDAWARQVDTAMPTY